MAGRRRVPWLLAGAMLVVLCLPASALAAPSATPTVTLDTPANGSVLTTAQPTFSGTSSTTLLPSTVTVHVHAGPDTAGALVQNLPAGSGGGSYSVTAATLPDGTYTAQAEQDVSGGVPGTSGFSAPVTFTVNTTLPHVVLDSPGSGPLTTAAPALTGTASAAPGDSRSVAVAIFPGASTSGSPIRFLSTTVGSGGTFSVTVAPGLPDGRYTAVAGQNGIAGSSLSNPVTFRIKVHPPALTLTSPAPGEPLATPQPTFGGAAGVELGDASSVSVTLHAGSLATGRSLGQQIVPVSNAAWSRRWPSLLALGTYTVVVVQSDDAGHTTTVSTTFRVIAAPQLIGSRVALSGSHAAIGIACTGTPGTTCRGTVLALTTGRLQTRAGSPVGPVRLLFAYVVIPAGQTQSVSGSLPAYVVRALRRVRHLEARVTVSFVSVRRSSAIRPVS